MHDISLIPPYLPKYGVVRQEPVPKADLRTIWDTPYPVISNYLRLCEVLGWRPFGGGSLYEQGSKDIAGYITSGYRDSTEGLQDAPYSAHKFGLAIDVAVGTIKKQIEIFNEAIKFYTRIGLYPKEKIVHLDLAPVVWMQRYNGKRFWVKHWVDGQPFYKNFDEVQELIYFAETFVKGIKHGKCKH